MEAYQSKIRKERELIEKETFQCETDAKSEVEKLKKKYRWYNIKSEILSVMKYDKSGRPKPGKEKIIAGLLCTYCNKDLFFHIIAHDSAFDNLRAGRLCCYYSIVSAIENKYERLHFLWGRYSYKLQFGAQEKKLIKLTIFRKSFYKFQFPACYIQKFLYKLNAPLHLLNLACKID
jgi:lipid II:glycine glycyltransferase (peptidoglycan interpeptide bridge formation enzyme)